MVDCFKNITRNEFSTRLFLPFEDAYIVYTDHRDKGIEEEPRVRQARERQDMEGRAGLLESGHNSQSKSRS